MDPLFLIFIGLLLMYIIIVIIISWFTKLHNGTVDIKYIAYEALPTYVIFSFILLCYWYLNTIPIVRKYYILYFITVFILFVWCFRIWRNRIAINRKMADFRRDYED